MKQMSKLTVIAGRMEQKTVANFFFLNLTIKRFFPVDGITSLPLLLPYLQDLNDYKEKRRSKDRKTFLARKR